MRAYYEENPGIKVAPDVKRMLEMEIGDSTVSYKVESRDVGQSGVVVFK